MWLQLSIWHNGDDTRMIPFYAFFILHQTLKCTLNLQVLFDAEGQKSCYLSYFWKSQHQNFQRKLFQSNLSRFPHFHTAVTEKKLRGLYIKFLYSCAKVAAHLWFSWSTDFWVLLWPIFFSNHPYVQHVCPEHGQNEWLAVLHLGVIPEGQKCGKRTRKWKK